MFQAERIDRLVFDLPGDDARAVAIPRDDARDEVRCCGTERRMLDGVTRRPPAGVVAADGGCEELGVAEHLHRTDAEDDLLAGPLGCVDLPVKVIYVELAGLGLDAIPIGARRSN